MRSLLAMVLAVALGWALSGCAKCAPKGAVESKPLGVEDIGKSLAPVICEKYSACNQGQEFNKEQCIKDITTGIGENLKQAQNMAVDQGKLDGCLAAVKAAACEALNSQTPPTGCEFLQ